MADPTRPLPSIPRRHTSATTPLSHRESLSPLPMCTAIDPRLQENPRHTLGPWPLSRTVSSSSSTPSVRSRANTTGDLSNATHTLEQIHEIHEMLNEYDQAIREQAEVENLPSQSMQEKVDSERAFVRDIFSIHDAMDDEEIPIPDRNISQHHHPSSTHPLLPQTSSIDSDSDIHQTLLPHQVYGTTPTHGHPSSCPTLQTHGSQQQVHCTISPLWPDNETTPLTARTTSWGTTSLLSESKATRFRQDLAMEAENRVAWLQRSIARGEAEAAEREHDRRRKALLAYLIYTAVLLITSAPLIKLLLLLIEPAASLTTGAPCTVFPLLTMLNSFNIGVLLYLAAAPLCVGRQSRCTRTILRDSESAWLALLSREWRRAILVGAWYSLWTSLWVAAILDPL